MKQRKTSGQVWVSNINASALIMLQWNLDLTKRQGTDKFIVISWFFFIYFTITGVKKIVCYIEDFVT